MLPAWPMLPTCVHADALEISLRETCAHLLQCTFAHSSATQHTLVYTYFLYQVVQARHTARSAHSTLVVLHLWSHWP